MNAYEIKQCLLDDVEIYHTRTWESLAKMLLNAISDESMLSHWRILAGKKQTNKKSIKR